MAISLTAGGIPCQEITPTNTGTTVVDGSVTRKVFEATLPSGVVTKIRLTGNIEFF